MVCAIDTVEPSNSIDGRPHVETADYRSLLPDVAGGAFNVVVHQAAVTDTLVSDSMSLRAINSIGVGALARASLEGGARFIFASSASVYGKIAESCTASVGDEANPQVCTGPINAYAQSKLMAEKELLQIKGLEFLAFRYTNVFGWGEQSKGEMACILTQMISQALQKKEIRLYADTLHASRDFVPVSRVANAVVYAAEQGSNHASDIYNLGSGVSVTFASILDWLTKHFSDREFLVRLAPNPVAGQYQYRTPVSTANTEKEFRLQPMTAQDVFRDAEILKEQLVVAGKSND
jgi:ADP-L-glycero-D-manno-heptose 6-epimerase